MNPMLPEKKTPPGSLDTFEKGRYEDEELLAVHAKRLLEKERRPVGFSLFPILFVFLFAFLVFWSGIYLARYTSGFNPLITNETVAAGRSPPSPPKGPNLAEIGEKVFQNCVACHQPTGLGVPGAFPPLAGSEWVHSAPERIVVIVMNGLVGPIEVKGSSFLSAMPPLGAVLSDEQIAGVATFVRGNEAWGNQSGPVSIETVTELRAQYGSRANMWSAEELKQTFPE